VLMTAMSGLFLAAPAGVPLPLLAWTVLGTAFVAGGAAALNQVWERDTDGRMERTRLRPLPHGRLRVGESTGFGLALSATGLAALTFGANLLSAAVAAVTLLSYLLLYTPLKRRTWLSTLIGAFPGALPPVIGWTAATGDLTLPALVLFAIVFLWQMPHFLAIAWLHRDDYARAGIPLLPVVEPDGRSTGRQARLYAGLLLPVSLLPAAVGLAGVIYLVAAVALGAVFVGMSARFSRDLSAASARHLFLASIVYLPCLWSALVASRVWLQ
ncbi:MAG: protoheme IX farnesyltransferase, partial [Acidimicrobiia bacterium]|nr:protoheme IX farnesyltransferase [Acidimicrobiia bacterium]